MLHLPYRLPVVSVAGVCASLALWSCAPTDWGTDDVAPASCDDERRNGAETDIDCGGSECRKCAVGDACLTGSDCVSGECNEGTCRESHCSNLVQDEDEEDVDCGGKDCLLCDGSDPCANGRKDENETDVDCGGSSDCARCEADGSCESDGDCLSGVCLHSVCHDDGTGTGGAAPAAGSGGGGRSAAEAAGAGGEDAGAVGAAGFGGGHFAGESGGKGAFAGAPSNEGGTRPGTGGTAEEGGSENTGGRPGTGGAVAGEAGAGAQSAGGREISGGAGGSGGGATGKTGGTGGSGGSTRGSGGSTGGSGGSTGGSGGSAGGSGGSAGSAATGGAGGTGGGSGGSSATSGAGGTDGGAGQGGSGGSSTEASGVVVLTVPLTAIGQGQRYNYQNYDGVGSYDLTGASLDIVACAPDAIGGNLHVFFTTPDRVDSPAVDVALSTLTTGLQTVSIPVPAASGGFDPATIMVIRIEVEARTGFGTTWQTPATVVYVDSISTSNGLFDDTFSADADPLAASGARALSGAMISWSSNYPP